MSLIFLTGGARSGKSTLAVSTAASAAGKATLVATAEPLDTDMSERIRRHRRERPKDWTVLEEPLDLVGALMRTADDDIVIVDCLTLWISNLVGAGIAAGDVEAGAVAAASVASERAGMTIVVTNEVGSGIVPVAPDVRAWRDLLGRVNAAFSARADRAYLVVAGRLLELQPPSVLLT